MLTDRMQASRLLHRKAHAVLQFHQHKENWCEIKYRNIKNTFCIQDAIVAPAVGSRCPPRTSCASILRTVQSRRSLDDVLEAECAVAREPLAFASAAQILSVGSFGIDVSLCYCTGAACFVASLRREEVLSGD